MKKTMKKKKLEAFRELPPEVSRSVQGGQDVPPPEPTVGAHIITGG